MAKKRRRYRDPLAPLTKAELRKQADLLLEAAISRPRSEIRRAQEEARRQAKEDEMAIQGFASALSRIAGQSPLGLEHQAAAGRQSALSQGFASGQQQAEQESANRANALLAAQGGPQSVQAGPLSQVTGYLGGLGASGLGSQGGALRDYAQGVVGSIGGRAQQQLLQRISEGQKEQSKLRESLEDLMAQVPSKRQEILNALYQREISKEATRTQRDYLGLAQGREAFDQSFDMAKLEADIAQGAASAKGKSNEAKLKARKARVSALEDAQGGVWRMAEELKQGTKVEDPSSISGFRTQRPSYQQAYKTLWARYGQGLMRYAPAGEKQWWKRQVDAMIANALRNNGFKKPRKTARKGQMPAGAKGPVG